MLLVQIARLLFWLSLALLLYVCVGYPLIVALLASRKRREVIRGKIEPDISIVIAAHNEAASIEKKIAGLLSLDYPADRMEILIGSDGSTDATAQIVRECADARIRLFDFGDRQGKPGILNQLVPAASGEIIVLSDVRQSFDSQVLRKLVEPFADPAVGAVSGELMLGRNPVGAYWRYEKFIRLRESTVDSTVGATGAVYAIRKSLFEPVPRDTILDDVLIPLRITRRGFRVLFEPGAVAYDQLPATSSDELTRKVRTLAGNFQLFFRERWLLTPIHNRLWWQTMSHKVGRLFIPVLQIALLASNSVLAPYSNFFRVALAAQLAFYVAATAGWVLHDRHRRFWPLTFPFTFCLLSCATVMGFIRFATRRQAVTWTKAASVLDEGRLT